MQRKRKKEKKRKKKQKKKNKKKNKEGKKKKKKRKEFRCDHRGGTWLILRETMFTSRRIQIRAVVNKSIQFIPLNDKHV